MAKLYRYRHMARVVVETATPLAVSSGNTDIVTDSPVVTDVNGMPYIPATSLAGVIRHALNISDAAKENNIFGYQDKKGGEGSRIIFTDAIMIGKEGEALDGIQSINWNDDFYAHYADLPIRQHVRISDRGTAEDSGKFDNQVVYKGTRFVFEIEVVSAAEDDKDLFLKALNQLYAASFRVGGGTRKGYGKLKVVSCKMASLDLTNANDLEAYCAKSSSLTEGWSCYQPYQSPNQEEPQQGWEQYTLLLSPMDFMFFSSGQGDEDADNVAASESVVTWDDTGKPQFKDKQVLIPASSVKGTIAHRTAYHYNKFTHYYASKETIGENKQNHAVEVLFGKAGEGKEDIKRGNVIMGDIIQGDLADKTFFHVKIDAFTGGTIDGALFQEKSANGRGQTYELEILVKKEALEEEEKVRMAFEQSLNDICEGLLPLGGATNRGYGIFTGKLIH